MLERRGFLTGLVSALTAPAIVRASSLMPVKAVLWTPPVVMGIDFGRDVRTLQWAVRYIYDKEQRTIRLETVSCDEAFYPALACRR